MGRREREQFQGNIYFKNWRDDLAEKVKPALPTFDEEKVQTFKESLQVWFDSAQELAKVTNEKRELDGGRPQPYDPNNKELVETLKETIDRFLDHTIPNIMDECYTNAIPLLETIGTWINDVFDHFDDDEEKRDILTSLMVHRALFNFKSLGTYCARSRQTQQERNIASDLVMDFFEENVPLLQEFLFHGGVAEDQYAHAIETYNILMNEETYNAKASPFTYRLAMACILELSYPLTYCHEFQSETTHETIDPAERYQYYLDAYHAGELDPVFDTFSIWELRWVVNHEAKNEDITWTRETLRAYRPDFIYNEPSYNGRYTRLVMRDVPYGKVEYENGIWTYQEFLSKGGQCGARSWMGQTLTKSFGIPTWGMREPAHAALIHWTPGNEWVEHLGFGLRTGFWKGRRATDFVLEAQARKVIPLQDYGRLVCTLDWIQDVMGEPIFRGIPELRNELSGHPDCLFWSLNILQRYGIKKRAQEEGGGTMRLLEEDNGDDWIRPNNRIESMINEGNNNNDDDEVIREVESSNGTIIVIPAACVMELPPHQRKGAPFHIMKSFVGGPNGNDESTCETTTPSSSSSSSSFRSNGKQVNLFRNGTLRYDLDGMESITNECTGGAREYALTCRVVTVHGRDCDLTLSISMEEKESSNMIDTKILSLPYTVGKLEETEPIHLTFGGSSTIMTVSCADKDSFGVVIKDFKLTPL